MNGENIYITLIDRQHVHHLFNVPRFWDLTLFDLIKRIDEHITCNCPRGKCHQCQVKIVMGADKLLAKASVELDILSRILDAGPASRIACQIRIRESLNGLIISLT